jgi:uncharacterized protein YprB with RNaseH-like and TPR domain
MADFSRLYNVTEDAARNKRKRLLAQADMPVQPSDDPIFEIPASPQGSFVGINTIYWDLETTGLTAIMGRLLCCGFADSFGNADVLRIEDFPGKTPIDDSGLAVAIRDRIERADHWVTWNGKLYDIPMLNARLLKAGERPVRTDIMHTDLMYRARGQFLRIGSSKLENVSKFINSPNRKTPLDWDTWSLAATGDTEAMDRIAEHAIADVLVTRDVFAVLKPHVRTIHR